MRKTPVLSLLFAIVVTSPVSVKAASVISVTGGQATGSPFFQFQSAFDAQPLTPPTAGNIAGPPDQLGAYIEMFAPGARQGYVDFGANFANVVIEETWTAFRAYSTYDGLSPFTSLWWSTSQDNIFDGGDVMETAFNFGTKPLSYNGQNVTWLQDYSGLAVTPQARYLIVSGVTFGLGDGNRATELAFVGSVVPEPSAYGMIIGGACFAMVVLRRRAGLTRVR